MEPGSRSPTFYNFRRDDHRDLSEIFNVYRLKEPILTRASHSRSMYSVSTCLKVAMTTTFVVLVLTCAVVRLENSRTALFGITVVIANRTDKTAAGAKQLANRNKGDVTPHRHVTAAVTDLNRETDLGDPEKIHKVLLLTYFRGGSSFLGDVFNNNPAAFYWFEPLAAPVFDYKRTNHVRDYALDSSANVIPRPPDLVERLLDVTEQAFDCDMMHIDQRVLTHYFATKWRKSAKFKKYQSCVRRYKARHSLASPTADTVAACRRFLEVNCDRSGLRVIKSIRLFVEEAAPLIHRDPDVRLVYYIRDPRGILLSRWSLVRVNPALLPLEKIEAAAAFLCAKVRTDMQTALRLRRSYPDRVVFLRYEDLATAPIAAARRLYGFLELDLPKVVEAWVRYATHAKRSDGTVGTQRKNSSAIAARWQTTLSADVIRVINQECADVIDLFYSDAFKPSTEYYDNNR